MKSANTPDVSSSSLYSLPSLAQSTAHGAKGIFFRFVLVAVGLNALVGVAVIIYDVADSISTTYDFLTSTGKILTQVAVRMRQDLEEPDEKVVRRASRLLQTPMALLDRQGKIQFRSHPKIDQTLAQVYQQQPRPGITFAIRKELHQLSGAWIISPFSDKHDLLLIVPRLPEDEGLIEYMTIAAGLIGIGLSVSFVVMLVAANWMLRRPLTKLVGTLTQALATDIHRRKMAEESAVAARLEAEEHLAFREYLIDASESVGIIATDADGLIQIFNRAAEQILAYDAQELVGKETLATLRDRSLHAATRSKSFLLLHPQEGEEYWFDTRENMHLLDIKRNDIRDQDGHMRGILVTFIDMTERRRLEAELQLNQLQLIQSAKMATLGEMATGVAHEINQPLNHIGLLATRVSRKITQLTISAEESEFFYDKLSKIHEQLDRAGKIIDHLRTFGRPRAKKLSAVKIQTPVDGVMVLLKEQLQGHDITITIDLPSDLPAVLADEAQLEQVLMNLLINARDALDEKPPDAGEKRIIFTAQRQTGKNQVPGVCIRVMDTGQGMTQEVMERIFEPFYSTKEVGKGTGLGLSISYGLINEFGGTLSAESQPNRGSTFSIWLKEAS